MLVLLPPIRGSCAVCCNWVLRLCAVSGCSAHTCLGVQRPAGQVARAVGAGQSRGQLLGQLVKVEVDRGGHARRGRVGRRLSHQCH